MKMIIVVLALATIMILPAVSAYELDLSVIMNTTDANASIIVDQPINIDLLEVYPNNISMYNVTCQNGTTYGFMSFPQENNNNLTSEFCPLVLETAVGVFRITPNSPGTVPYIRIGKVLIFNTWRYMTSWLTLKY